MSNRSKTISAYILIIYGVICVLAGFFMLFANKEQTAGIILMFVMGGISGLVGLIVMMLLAKNNNNDKGQGE